MLCCQITYAAALFLQEYDPDALSDSEGELFVAIFMTANMIDELPRSKAVGMDAKWGLNAAGVPMHALLDIRPQTTTKPGERRQAHPAFDAGYVHHAAQVLAIVLCSRDNYHAHRVSFKALRLLMPCLDLNCSHEIVLVEDPRGYHLQTACTSLRAAFDPIVMIDLDRPWIVSRLTFRLLCFWYTRSRSWPA